MLKTCLEYIHMEGKYLVGLRDCFERHRLTLVLQILIWKYNTIYDKCMDCSEEGDQLRAIPSTLRTTPVI